MSSIFKSAEESLLTAVTWPYSLTRPVVLTSCVEDGTGCVSTSDDEVFFVNWLSGEVFLLSD